MTFAGSLAGLLSEVVSFALEEHAGMTIEKLKVSLLEAGKNWLKLGLLTVMVLELSLKSVWWKQYPLNLSKSVTSWYARSIVWCLRDDSRR